MLQNTVLIWELVMTLNFKNLTTMKLFVQIFIDPDPSGEIQMFWNTV